MSTSFTYQAVGLQGYEYARQEFEEGNVSIKEKPKWRLLRGCKTEKFDLVFNDVLVETLHGNFLSTEPG